MDGVQPVGGGSSKANLIFGDPLSIAVSWSVSAASFDLSASTSSSSSEISAAFSCALLVSNILAGEVVGAGDLPASGLSMVGSCLGRELVSAFLPGGELLVGEFGIFGEVERAASMPSRRKSIRPPLAGLKLVGLKLTGLKLVKAKLAGLKLVGFLGLTHDLLATPLCLSPWTFVLPL
ncbi:MAG: hypothetical protein WBE14_02150 [Xanthobacteraceae bacterium]